MTLSEEAKRRLADVVALQPTKNATLAEAWDLPNGKAVHQYLESELSEYYYRDDNSLIRATPEAAALVDVEPGIQSDATETVVRISSLQRRVLDVLPESPDSSASVVAVLHALREDAAPDGDGEVETVTVDDVRSALSALKRKDLVAVEYRGVPTYYRVEAPSVTVKDA